MPFVKYTKFLRNCKRYTAGKKAEDTAINYPQDD